MRFGRRPERIALAAATAALLSLLALPQVRGPLVAGAARLADVGPAELTTGGLALVLAQAAMALAWRSALRSCGAVVSLKLTAGCYGAGSLANSFLPGGVGDALRIDLFARAAGKSSRWLCGGVCLGLNVGRGVVFSALLLAGAADGLVPGKLLFAPVAATGAAAVAAWALRRRRGRRLRQMAIGASSVTPAVLGWLALVLALRFGAAVYLLHALGAGDAFPRAIVLLTALGASSLVSLTPGNIGIASAAVAVALAHTGLDPGTAVAVGIAYHSLETAAGIGFGAIGCVLRGGSVAAADEVAELGDLALERRDAVLEAASWL